MELKPCPFPHNRAGGRVGLFYEQLGTIETYWIGCSCGARGPWGTSKEEAADNWSARASQWISVKDRLPEIGQLVLAHTPGLDSGRHIAEIRLLNWFAQCEATSWQPVEPPTE
jgi:hypothetical protein